MTEALYLNDAYLKEFDAKVLKGESGKVILDKTAFYPDLEGQPCDFGKIIRKSDNKEFIISKVEAKGSDIYHLAEGLKEGDEVKGLIDWERRYTLMKMHTATHIIGAVVNLQTEAIVLNVQLDTEKSYIEFDKDINKNSLVDYFSAINDAVNWDLPVVIHNVTQDVLMQDKKLAKLLVGAPAANELRIIEVNIFNKQICYGTHVNRTKEIGKIILADSSNRRVYFKLDS